MKPEETPEFLCEQELQKQWNILLENITDTSYFLNLKNLFRSGFELSWLIQQRKIDNLETKLKKFNDVALLKTQLETQLAIAVEALMFYSKPLPSGNTFDDIVGQRKEFGCGCCVGTVVATTDSSGEPDTDLDYNGSIQGLTAREALAKIEELNK